MIDIHAHLCFPEFDKDRDSIIENAKKSLTAVIASSARYDEGLCVLELSKKYKGFVFPSLGYHPTEGTKLEETIQLIRDNKNNIVSIGEVGLDFHWEKDPAKREHQKKVFETFIQLAIELKKPLVIHSWDAEKHVFEMVKDRGVECAFHCYTGSKELAKEIVDSGFYISLSTNLNFSKNLQKIAKFIPMDKFLLETDSPFLDPDRDRKRNTPENILISAERMSKLKHVSIEEITKAAEANAKKLFKI